MQQKNAMSWLSISVLIFVLDFFSKKWALANLQYQQSVEVISGFWNWTLVHNTGAAFSFLANAGGWQHFLFSALAVIISCVCIVMLIRTPRADWRNALPLALIIGGALGNLVDRIRFGYVIDFVHWFWRDNHFPVFNVADSAITLAAVVLIIFSFSKENKASE